MPRSLSREYLFIALVVAVASTLTEDISAGVKSSTDRFRALGRALGMYLLEFPLREEEKLEVRRGFFDALNRRQREFDPASAEAQLSSIAETERTKRTRSSRAALLKRVSQNAMAPFEEGKMVVLRSPERGDAFETGQTMRVQVEYATPEQSTHFSPPLLIETSLEGAPPCLREALTEFGRFGGRLELACLPETLLAAEGLPPWILPGEVALARIQIEPEPPEHRPSPASSR